MSWLISASKSDSQAYQIRRLMVIGAWIAALVLASPQAIIFRWPHKTSEELTSVSMKIRRGVRSYAQCGCNVLAKF